MKINKKKLEKLHSDLIAFWFDSQVPKNADDIDPNKSWIISKGEQKALDAVIGMVADCIEMGGITTKVAFPKSKKK
jgi:hypothetical protein